MNISSKKSEHLVKSRIDKILASRHATQDDCKLLITECNELIEYRNEKHLYPLICWYRNWLSHPSLDNSADRILQELESQFTIPESEQSTCDKIAELFSTKKLRSEFKLIIKSIDKKLPFLDSYSLWKDFLGSILFFITEKPITSKKNKANQIVLFRRINRIQKKLCGHAK